MAGWITTAVRTLGRRRRRMAALELLCVCGEGVALRRTPHAQEIRCPRCGERLFVLPADVYPATPRRAATPPADRAAPPRRPAVKSHGLGRRLLGAAVARFAACLSRCPHHATKRTKGG